MEKRIHTRRSRSLPYRNYLLQFKWTLLVFCFFVSIVLLNKAKLNSFAFSSIEHNDNVEFSFIDVIYPIDVLNPKDLNKSISYYFARKEELKLIDDAKAIDRKEKVVLPLTNNKFPSKSYLILEFTHVFQRPRFCSHSKEQIFGKTCPYKNCDYTCDEKHEEDADVLLMHKRDLDFKQLTEMTRNSEQIWLLWHDEPNENTAAINKYKFNWTITYRTSAEASLAAYGITVVKENPWPMEKLSSWIDKEFKKRYNQAVWFVSNCKPKKRLAKFQSLRQHYPIVAFGKCISSTQSYSLNANVHSSIQCGRESNCEHVYLSTSKFYLAFESQSCTDYITEKFWRTLSVGAIPIVSGPEQKSFARVAPPNSFVHVDDYASDKELSVALNLIATNRTLYGKYHAWRRYYDAYYQAKDVDPYRFCELCYRLNTNKQRIWYENINDWFLEKC
ncbi:unnamed protein product [Rotaria socialis]|uniref:Fucosyltransferase n=1 Tax=Rotaria socialis TaxID=392032 RepID=A0A817ZCM5_9BILA|nr:unnamed protein product [Rotaria socialis]CAF3381483.1 unnamed protein product [Rotaria socialis]CAF3393151.1 unnamed protein product [Rotaria socialis]CAF3419395.1 unnamed protein product [Rotaria socialis]CAF3432812.1 unnamed protein product [Rotaria socialis]